MVVWALLHRQSLAVARAGAHTEVMANRLVTVLASIAALGVLTFPGGPLPTVVPADRACAGGICEVCPAVAKTLSATGAQIYCIA